jgi:flagellar basal-body rod modification protein FlgD
MVALPAVNLTGRPSAAITDASRAAVDYDAFLRLLIAQMKNQDPTQPVDPSQSLAQLASFSAVEQSIKTNGKLDSLLALAAVGQAASLIGRYVSNHDDSIGGVVKSIEVDAGGSAAILEDGRRIALGAGLRVE